MLKTGCSVAYDFEVLDNVDLEVIRRILVQSYSEAEL